MHATLVKSLRSLFDECIMSALFFDVTSNIQTQIQLSHLFLLNPHLASFANSAAFKDKFQKKKSFNCLYSLNTMKPERLFLIKTVLWIILLCQLFSSQRCQRFILNNPNLLKRLENRPAQCYTTPLSRSNKSVVKSCSTRYDETFSPFTAADERTILSTGTWGKRSWWLHQVLMLREE